ncbi:hypothetical protein [Reichenbachiella sp.]|uniref:hypothetical protein n=1 Tax=Reichenbachiella sp. TaxID=2184521 RepID=UPI00329A57D5
MVEIRKKFSLPEESKVTQEVIEQLDNLISFSSPKALRKSLLKVYLQFIINEHEALPTDFDDIACDFYMLVEFLTMAEEEMR